MKNRACPGPVCVLVMYNRVCTVLAYALRHVLSFGDVVLDACRLFLLILVLHVGCFDGTVAWDGL